MGRSTCCAKEGLKKGPWTPEEDQKLVAYIEQHGHGSWSAVPAKAGLKRCGKSCRLRWINYLRPDIKRGKFSLREEQTIIQLHALLGNRWSSIATYLPKRTDNEIKNHWNTHLKKRLTKMGIDPMTHKPKTNMLGSTTGHSKEAANLSHMAQWESARLEAEARLAKESKQSLANINPRKDTTHQLSSISTTSLMIVNKVGATPRAKPQCLDVLKAWQGVVTGMLCFQARTDNLESPTSILNFPQKMLTNQNIIGSGSNFYKESLKTNQPIDQEEGRVREKLLDDPIALFNEMTSTYSTDGAWFQDSNFNTSTENILENMSNTFAFDSAGNEGNPLIVVGENSEEVPGSDSFDQDKNYWNDDSVIDLVDSSTAWSPIF